MKALKLFIIGIFMTGGVSLTALRPIVVTGFSEDATLDVPTGVLATDNIYNNKVGVYWDAIRQATSYRIFKSTTNDLSTATDIGTTPATFFFDLSAAPGQTAFYWVRAENSSSVSALSTPDQGTRAAAQQQGPVPPLDPPPPAPPGNALTAAKTYLGKVLFWDEQMSSTRTVSCGTCHHSGFGGVDPRTPTAAASVLNPGNDGLNGTADDIRGSFGVPSNNPDGTYNFIQNYGFNDQVTGRKSVSYVNAAYSPVLFWDGRATGVYRDPITSEILLNGGAALESQAAGPPVSSAEMAHGGRDWNDVAARIAASKPLALSPSVPANLSAWVNGRSYAELFAEAFGTPEVTPARISMAIASFERSLFSDQAPIDTANAGITQLTAQEQRGRNTFTTAGCATCHAGNLLTDNQFHYIGVRPQNEDTGRFQVTGNNNNRGEFRTPSLRNVELRGSYFHNGQFTTLEQVVAFYNRGGDFNAPNKTNQVRPLGLNQQQQDDLVAFLKRPLTDPRVRNEAAPFDRPTLYTESSRVPQVSGAGRPGSGSFTPQIKAISPPLVGNPNFTVSVSSALGNAQAVLVVDASDPGEGTSIPATGSFARVTTNTVNTGAGNGWASVGLAIPDSSAVAGKTFFARWYVQDPSAANGFAVSPLVTFTVFGQPTIVSSSFSITGTVSGPDGRGLRNAMVSLSDMQGNTLATTLTSPFGNYRFAELPIGTYQVSVRSRRYSFASQTVSLAADLANVNFVGTE